MFINYGHASVVEKHEDEFKCLSRVVKNVFCVPITNVSPEMQCVRLVTNSTGPVSTMQVLMPF
jgi:hypothetical protein